MTEPGPSPVSSTRVDQPVEQPVELRVGQRGAAVVRADGTVGEGALGDVVDVREGAPVGTAAAPSRVPAPAAGADQMRASNTQIPAELLEAAQEHCRQTGLSHGDLIITAIEHVHPRLRDLIHPPVTAGGGLFAARRSWTPRRAAGPVTPFTYRLWKSDFRTLDVLVQEVGATSRAHLITVALTDYLTSDPSSSTPAEA